MAMIFSVNRPAIVKHINNIYKTKELVKSSTCSILEQVAADNKKRRMNFYNLDMVISVGYRVNSQRATQFRIWATKVLKEHIVKGYTINETRLLDARGKLEELQRTIAFLNEKSKKDLLTDQSVEILSLLANYSKTLSTLEEYDKGNIKAVKGKKAAFILSYDNCLKIIEYIKRERLVKEEAGNLFGIEREGSFKGLLGNLYQTFGRKELYPTIETKASHLLYFTIKDHPFSDGNKRIASFLFIYYLNKIGHLNRKNGERKINDNGLTALALLIAESDPKEKEIMIKLVQQLISD
jgi:prophage maintenance system killer protein